MHTARTFGANGNTNTLGTWEDVDRELRALAMRRCALDAEEATLLRAAVQCQLWRELGKASLLEYLEEVLGYSPRAANERVRVATALRELPELALALERGELHWSAVRELTRIVTPETEAEWLDDARDKNLRQIEHAVSGRSKGDRPSDPERPNLRPRHLSFEVSTEVDALVRQARQALANERGGTLDDNTFLGALCQAYLAGGTGAEVAAQRAKYQIMMSLCPACGQGYQEAGGRRHAVDNATVERATCDAEWIGSDTAPAARATQDITPKTRRFVVRRDGGRCCVPGCRSTRFLDLHHVVARADGGGHGPENLTVTCDAHHRALHEGKLSITGTAPDLIVRWLRPAPIAAVANTHVGRDEPALMPRPSPASSSSISKFAIVAFKTEARRALVQLGFKNHEATAAIDAAANHLGASLTLETLLREALRRCPRPT